MAATALLARPARAQTAAPVIRMGTILADSFAQPFFAVDGGFLERAGINGQVTVFPGSGAISTAVAAGAIDIGLCDAIVIANGLIHNVPFATIAGSGLFTGADPTGLLCVDKASTLKDPRDLSGKSIAVPSLGSLTTLAIEQWLLQNKADPAGVKYIELPFVQVAPALAHGTVDAGYIGEPVLASTLGTATRSFGNPYAALGPQVLICNWVTTRDWLARNRDLARRFVTAMSETAQWANQHRDLTAPILAKYSKIDLEQIKAMRRALFATVFDPKMLQPSLEAAYKFKLISRAVAVDELMTKP
ncbi:MAG TPA: ABC transporter substrate-binding protein [Candidatus Lustribacter sp.]|nr:ABC transporter substrate-binding protein [Candidatus Lustribacter sp.]